MPSSPASFFRRAADAPYRGPVQGVILDWAGTSVDHGCLGPLAPFIDAFAEFGVQLSSEEARGPMGLLKRDHLAALFDLPAIRERWRAARGREFAPEDLEPLYARVEAGMLERAADFALPIRGASETCRELRERGLRIGSSTGYTRAIIDRVRPVAAMAGFAPDFICTPEDVAGGRPAPWMIYRNAAALGLHPPEAIIKLGDTQTDMEEGLNAGCWSCGVSATGNLVGCAAEELAALPTGERTSRIAAAEAKLREAGAHFVIESISDLPALVDSVNERLAAGESPPA